VPKVLPSSPIYVGQSDRHSIFPLKSSSWGASIDSTSFFEMGQSNMLIATKQKCELVRHPQQINMKENKISKVFFGRAINSGQK
jgi:hypothetical protein